MSLRLKGLWITLPAVAVFAIVACAGQRIQVSDVVSPAHTDQQDGLRHCRLQGVTPVGSGAAAILCAGDESWLARGHGSKLELKKLHPYAPGAGFTVSYLREGKVEAIRQFPQLIRQIAIDHEGQAKIRDWSVARGSPAAAAAGSEGTVFVLFRQGDSRCYLNDLRTPERAAGRVVAWSRSCVTGSAGIIPRADRRHLLWMTTERGIALGSPEAVTDRVPISWQGGSKAQLLTSAIDGESVGFVVRDDSGIRVIRKAAAGQWLSVHVGGTSTLAESSCAESLQPFFARADKHCDSRGHRVEVAAMVRSGSSLWLVLGTHRYQRRIRQRIEGGGPAMRLRGDVVANQERVELSLLEIVAGRSSTPSWIVAASESKALDCLDPQKAHHTLDDLKAVRLAIAKQVVHVAAQNSERLFHFALDVGRRKMGDKQVVLTRKILNTPAQDGSALDTAAKDRARPVKPVQEAVKVKVAPAPEVPLKACEAGQRRCGQRRCVDLRSDVAHCGACRRRCLSGRCDRGTCAPICYRDRDCAVKAVKAGVAGAGHNQICVTRDRRVEGVKRRPQRCSRPGSCGLDKTCQMISAAKGLCGPRTCRRSADCQTPGARCLTLPGQRKRQCFPPGHCTLLTPVPRAR